MSIPDNILAEIFKKAEAKRIELNLSEYDAYQSVKNLVEYMHLTIPQIELQEFVLDLLVEKLKLEEHE